ncbi:MAG TPA: cytochrome c-type biogenesis protein [Nitrospiria bacterium]|nr:cytochrome c-type biogenesis protein [Nitrospiria bacterium]
MNRIAFMVIALLLTGSWAALPAFAPIEARAAQVDETALDDQVREIAKTLRCAICQTENIWESQSVLAAQMRSIIRERLKAGETPDQIKAYFLSRYGDYILMKPRVRGWNWVIWAGPFVLLLIGGIVLTRTLSRWSASAASTPADPLPPLSEPSRKRIDNELRAYDQ